MSIRKSLFNDGKSAGRWTLDAGRWTLDAGRWTLDAGRWTLDAGRWTLIMQNQPQYPGKN
ncbi:hypothetical protein [Alloalcanivorax xenomutans]|uniref:hypothetical protein n=1 Tax=Alloalcanivorax xenomutans TaxID=1094342 RepID=UPI003BA8D78F